MCLTPRSLVQWIRKHRKYSHELFKQRSRSTGRMFDQPIQQFVRQMECSMFRKKYLLLYDICNCSSSGVESVGYKMQNAMTVRTYKVHIYDEIRLILHALTIAYKTLP